MQISVYAFDNCRDYLCAVLAGKNSLRRFAQQSGISPSYLSRIISGKRPLTRAGASKIVRCMQLLPSESNYLQNLVDLQNHQRPELRVQAMENLVRLKPQHGRTIPLESFKIIADWYHFAILVLSKTWGFTLRPQWLAKRLGITAAEAKQGVRRLIDLGLLEKRERWRAVDGAALETPHDVTSSAVQENHRQHLKLADQALSLAIELREFANLTLAMNVNDIPEAKRRIREFLDLFDRDMDRSEASEVFQLNVQFYKLSHSEGDRK
jgi:uncharacterized protein (TIGR02147 family)